MKGHESILDNSKVDEYRAGCSCGWWSGEIFSHPMRARQAWARHCVEAAPSWRTGQILSSEHLVSLTQYNRMTVYHLHLVVEQQLSKLRREAEEHGLELDETRIIVRVEATGRTVSSKGATEEP